MRAATGFIDPLGVVLAVATGLLIIALQEGPFVAAAAAVSVLGVRIAAGAVAVWGLRPSDEATKRLPAKWYTPLSPKEAETALLAAEGLTDREIAERLDRDVRTPETHMRHCFEKLTLHTGTPYHNRAQVAVWITQQRARAARETAPEAPRRNSVLK